MGKEKTPEEREKYNAYMRDYLKKRYFKRRNWAIKHLGGKCVDCGSTENLEFDHVDPSTKSYPISHHWNQNWEIFVAEVDKCELRCTECHVKKSIKNGDIPPRATHGTPAMYRHHGCRCVECTKANSSMQKEYRERRRLRELDKKK